MNLTKEFLDEDIVRQKCPGTIKSYKSNHKHYLTEIENEKDKTIKHVCLIKECSNFQK